MMRRAVRDHVRDHAQFGRRRGDNTDFKKTYRLFVQGEFVATISPETAAAAAQFDKSTLGEKVRVHTIAKQLGVRASDFLGVLEDHGIAGKKTASTLTRSQVEGLLDAIAGGNASGSASELTSA